jgi:hypothetical protein
VCTARGHVTGWNPSDCAHCDSGAGEGGEGEEEEERVRAVVVELLLSLDTDIAVIGTHTQRDTDTHTHQEVCCRRAWKACVLAGQLAEANAILDRHCGGQWPELSAADLKILLSEISVVVVSPSSPPEMSIPAADLALWIEGSLVPELYSRQPYPPDPSAGAEGGGVGGGGCSSCAATSCGHRRSR